MMSEAVLSVPEFIDVYGEDLEYLGGGCDRTGYYSPKTQTVVKVTYDRENDQHDAEIALIEKMTEEEKRIFPVVDVREFDGFHVIEMRKVKLLQEVKREFLSGFNFQSLTERWHAEGKLTIAGDGHDVDDYQGLIEAGLTTVEQVEKLSTMLYKYDQADCHDCNLGFDEQTGDLCVIDLGVSSELRQKWDSRCGSEAYCTRCERRKYSCDCSYCSYCCERSDNCECGSDTGRNSRGTEDR